MIKKKNVVLSHVRNWIFNNGDVGTSSLLTYTEPFGLFLYIFNIYNNLSAQPIMLTESIWWTPLKSSVYIGQRGVYKCINKFSYFGSKTDCGHSFEPPHWSSSNKHLQCMFGAEIRKLLSIIIKYRYEGPKSGWKSGLCYVNQVPYNIDPVFSPVFIPFLKNAFLIINSILLPTSGSHYLLSYVVSYETSCIVTQVGIPNFCLWE